MVHPEHSDIDNEEDKAMLDRSTSNVKPFQMLAAMSWILLWALGVVSVVFAEALWFARPAIARGDLTTIENHLVRKLHDATVDRRLGNAALVLVQANRVVAERGFGVANASTQAPVNPDRTLYQLASVSKAVTAWGVMKLVEEGRLGLDEPIVRHLKRWRFPGSEAYRDKVTVRHLLSHTAGLDDGLGYGGFLPGEAIQTLEESLTLTKDTTVGEPRPVRVAREPGKDMSYSGGGYTILQLLIEEVTNRSFADYMKVAVLQPLGMTKASFDLAAIASEGRSQDLATSYDSELKVHPTRRHTATAAVSLYATPRDLAQFVQAYSRENPVLRQETLKEMMMPQPGTSGSWGLGQTLFAANDAGGHVVGHAGGSLPGWGATMRVNPATGNGIVLVVSGGRTPVSRLANDWVYWETGMVPFDARLDIVRKRIIPASVAIVAGAIALVWWKLFRWKSRL